MTTIEQESMQESSEISDGLVADLRKQLAAAERYQHGVRVNRLSDQNDNLAADMRVNEIRAKIHEIEQSARTNDQEAA